MVAVVSAPRSRAAILSVLALSSRFDGRFVRSMLVFVPDLSVLALSSRFDGHFVAGH